MSRQPDVARSQNSAINLSRRETFNSLSPPGAPEEIVLICQFEL